MVYFINVKSPINEIWTRPLILNLFTLNIDNSKVSQSLLENTITPSFKNWDLETSCICILAF